MKKINASKKLVAVLVDASGNAIKACTDGINDGIAIITDNKEVFRVIEGACKSIIGRKK